MVELPRELPELPELPELTTQGGQLSREMEFWGREMELVLLGSIT